MQHIVCFGITLFNILGFYIYKKETAYNSSLLTRTCAITAGVSEIMVLRIDSMVEEGTLVVAVVATSFVGGFM